MELSTPRLRLRELTTSDIAALQRYQRDPRYQQHYDGPQLGVGAIIAAALSWAREDPRRNYQLAITRAGDDTPIGLVGLRTAGRAAGEAELGVEVAPDHWGAGFAEEAVRALLAAGIPALGVTRVVADCARSNTRVHRLLERLAFRREPAPPASQRIKYTLDVP